MSELFLNGICKNCFYEVQKVKGCVCPLTKINQGDLYYCSLCEKIHGLASLTLCKKCSKRCEENEIKEGFFTKKTFLKVILPTAIIALIIGFFLGWLLLVKLPRKRLKKSSK